VKGLAELKNKVVNAPHLNIFKVATWTTLGAFATFLLVYVFVGDQIFNFTPLLIAFAFGAPFISLIMSKSTVKRAYNIRMIDNGGARTEKEQLVVDTITLLSEKLKFEKLPEIGVYPSNDINAFATGPSKNSSMVAVSQGLLDNMNETEIIGVLAHEMSHIVNGDMLTSTILEGFVSAFSIIFSLLIYLLLSSGKKNSRAGGAAASMASFFAIRKFFNLLGRIVASWYSRRREYGADKLAAQITDPSYMKSALVRLQEISEGRINLQPNDREFAAFKISNNFSMNGFAKLFATHPSLEKRISAVERLEK